MQRIKGRSSRKLQQEFAHLQKRVLGKAFLGRGYFCATSGRLTDEQIKDYLEGYDEPPDPEFAIKV
ncbi:REP element-mobilizing transposase RayT [Salinibacter ruber]|nr:REP element-mobilizing transposase RayT [Salinibacter ruber]